MDQIINKTIDFVKEYFSNEFSGHDFSHTMRVYNLATFIAKKEKADLTLVSLVALLHDVDDIKISPLSNKNKDNARNFLKKCELEERQILLICDMISEISYKGTETLPAKSLESKIVQDADRLDAIGAIGIARAFSYGGNHNRVMYDPEILPKLDMNENEYRNHVSTTLNHFYEKLFNLKKLMNTKTAIKIAKRRDKYMRKYVSTFIKEWNGER